MRLPVLPLLHFVCRSSSADSPPPPPPLPPAGVWTTVLEDSWPGAQSWTRNGEPFTEHTECGQFGALLGGYGSLARSTRIERVVVSLPAHTRLLIHRCAGGRGRWHRRCSLRARPTCRTREPGATLGAPLDVWIIWASALAQFANAAAGVRAQGLASGQGTPEEFDGVGPSASIRSQY